MRSAPRSDGECRRFDLPPSRARAAVAVLLLALPAATTAVEPELERVTRSGFAMDLPAWQIELDQDNGADGRHVRVQERLRVEVGWTLDGAAGLAELDLAIAGLEHGHQATRVERTVEHPPGQLRLSSLLDFGGRAWLAITQVACREAGVLATITVMAPDRSHAQRLHDALLPTFACRDDTLPRLVDAWPATDLSHEFGVVMDGSPVLAHPDGRSVLIGKLAPATIAGMGADPERARRAFAAYGEAMGFAWSVRAPAISIRNLSGPAFAWTLDSASGPVAASAFTCGDGASGYVLFVADEAGSADPAALHALSERFGCPDLPLPSVLRRPSACEAGVADLCQP